jgi:hypothetical protein
MTEQTKVKITPVFTLLAEAVKIWGKNLRKFIMVYLVGIFFALLPLLAILVVYSLSNLMGNTAELAWWLLLILVSIVGGIFAFYFALRAYMALFLLVKKNYVGDEMLIFKETAPLFWPYVGLVLLTAGLVLLWTLLLIIPGIIYSIFYSLACYAFFFEGKTGMTAIRRSIQLVRGYWWPVLGRFIVLGVVLWLVMLIISLPLSFTSLNSNFYQIWSGVIQVINFLIGPIALLFTYQIYKDLVKIKPA